MEPLKQGGDHVGVLLREDVAAAWDDLAASVGDEEREQVCVSWWDEEVV